MSGSLGPREALYKEVYPRLTKFSPLLQHYYFLVSALSCPEDTGSAPVACVRLGETEPFVTVTDVLYTAGQLSPPAAPAARAANLGKDA